MSEGAAESGNHHLLPYQGDDQFRRERIGRPHQRREYGGDLTGQNSYAFNALGFRGPEYDPNARWQLFAFGCSHTFGTALDLDETWPSRFHHHLCESRGIDSREVGLVNFGESGASNDYIARTLISQCSRVKPDFVVANFTRIDRTEVFAEGRTVRLGSWYLDTAKARALIRYHAKDPRLQARIKDLMRRNRAFFNYATDEVLAMNTLKNILLVQFFCAVEGIPCVAFLEPPATSLVDLDNSGGVFDPLSSLVDLGFLYSFGMAKGVPDVDRAADGTHFGPRVHDAVARALLVFARSRLETVFP